jgi:hypothetical protein
MPAKQQVRVQRQSAASSSSQNSSNYITSAYRELTSPDNATVVRSVLMFGVSASCFNFNFLGYWFARLDGRRGEGWGAGGGGASGARVAIRIFVLLYAGYGSDGRLFEAPLLSHRRASWAEMLVLASMLYPDIEYIADLDI